jgi:two-component system sensor kinase FixL
MSGSKKNLGIVLDCSQNIERIFGYEKEMIRNNNINKIMPKYYADHHDGFLLKHYETGKIKLSDRTAVVPVR